jgi:uncharacterized protein YjbI with pentapeptide repeats
MEILNKLIGQRGDALSILGLKGHDAPVDLSNDRWDSRLEVLKNLEFEKVRLARKEIVINFVECEFRESEFVSLRSKNHLWGASNLWLHCVFDSVNLVGAISPMNTFAECRFVASQFVRYRPYQTLFARCQFEESDIVGMKAELVLNSTKLNRNLAGNAATVVFKECTFKKVSFRECYFAGVAFEDCQFENTDAQNCDFSGVVAEDRWWQNQKSEPFTVFLVSILELIGKKCGTASAAYSEFENYLLDYKTGKASNDFSACLYSGRVPNTELDKIEEEVRELMERSPV